MATALSYPTISGVTGAPYLSALTDTANIQDTINYLYYGSTKGAVITDGVYGMLTKLQTQITGLQTGINVHESAKWATTTTLAAVYAAGTADASAGTGTGATITFSATGVQKIDSATINIALNERILVKDGTTALPGTTSVANGIYYVSTLPAIGVAGILTRALDSDNSVAGEMSEGDFLYVTDGDSNANEAFMLTTSSATGTNPSGGQGAIRIGTDSVTFTQFIGVGSYYIGSTQAAITTAPATGSPLAGLSTIGIQGGTSGTITLNTVAVAGTNTVTIPALTGTIAINPTTTIGDIVYASATGTPGTLARLAGNTTNGIYVLTSQPVSSAAVAPVWSSAATGTGSPVFSASPTLTGTLVAPTISSSTASAGVVLALQTSATTTLGSATGNITITTGAQGSSSSNAGNNSGSITIDTGSAGNGGTRGAISIGTSVATSTINLGTGVSATAQTKTINIGTNSGAGSITTITMGSTLGTPTIALNGAVTLGTTGLLGPVSMDAFNTVSTTLNIGGAATTFTLGSTTAGTTTVQAGTTLNLNAPTISTNVTTGTLALFNTNLTTATVNMFGSLSSGTLNIASGTAGAKTINIGTSTGTTTIAGTVINSGDGVILKTASFTVGTGEKNYNVTGIASVTVTLPTATAGRTINIVNKAAFTIVSASSNVMPRTGTQTLGTAICAASVGSFATLVADGTNWYIMAGA